MPARTLLTIFDEGKNHVQVLVQSMPRSFKMHVWACRLSDLDIATKDMKYLGTIQPADQTDYAELEYLVQDLFNKKFDSIVE